MRTKTTDYGSNWMPNRRITTMNRPKQTAVILRLASMVSPNPSRGNSIGNHRHLFNVGRTYQDVYHRN